jgi:predicted ribosome-associated RNA-binding protein Tma20
MIPKSMSRKDGSFSQLYEYFQKDEQQDSFSHNLYSKNKDEIIEEFKQNSMLLKNARGSVYLYHEVLALQENDLTIERQNEILQDLTSIYVNKRANDNLVYGVIHTDTEHTHMHLMISSNKVGHNKRHRLSKKELHTIQAGLESYKNEKYKDELSPTYHYTKELKDEDKQTQKSSMSEQEIKHRRKSKTKKEILKDDLQSIFDKSLSQKALENSLQKKGYEIYQRGKTIGVIYEDKKYRLKTLGLEESYNRTLKKSEKREARQEKRANFKDEQINQRFKTDDLTR